MKTIFTLGMIVLITLAGLSSINFFSNEHYYRSALLTIAAFMAINLTVFVLSSKKISAQKS